MIWAKDAIDYDAGVTIYDPVTNKVYTHEEALQASEEIKHRLLLKPNKIGCWVYEIEEFDMAKNEAKYL